MEDNKDGDVTILKAKYTGRMALGFMGAVGANFPLSDNLSVFAEVNTINQSYSPKKGELKEATFNGEDKLPDMTTSQKEVEYVDVIGTHETIERKISVRKCRNCCRSQN